MNLFRLAPLALVISLAACNDDAAPADAVADTPAPAVPAPAPPPAQPVPPSPAPDGAVYDAALINFGGYRSARFNDDADAVRAAFAGTLAATPPPDSPEACHYLIPPTPAGGSYGTAFMFEGGKFVRVDVDSAAVVAPGGITTGMRADAVRAAFPDLEEQPHKYVDGAKYLVVRPADGGEARLVFETDAAGVVSEWRIGLEPQVHYVEGCS